MVHKIGDMRNIIFAALFFAFFSPAISQVYIDPGIGAVFKDNTGNLSPRFNIGAHNLVFNRLGVYGTLEIARKPGLKLISETDERDIIGGIFRVNNLLSFYAGVGMFSNGLLSNGFSLTGVRKEAGISFRIPSTRLNIDLGYSRTNKLSANIGFVIPYGKSSKNEKVAGPAQTAPTSVVAAPQSQPVPENVKSDVVVTEGPEKKSVVNDPAEALSEPVDISQIQTPKPQAASSQSPQDSENLIPGFYAINGVFRNRQHAVDELTRMKGLGFDKSQIGYRPSTGLYYVWLSYSKVEQEIKNFVLKNRDSGKLTGVWMLRIN